MRSHFIGIAGVIALALSGPAQQASAAEFLVHDDIFTLDETGDHNHGFYWYDSIDGTPSDWQSPDDYFNGEFFIRFEVLSQATARMSYMQYCFWQDDGARETCSPHLELNGSGSVATHHSSPSTWWALDDNPVDFSRPEDFNHLGTPLWNSDRCIVSDWSDSFCWDDRDDYFPMTARMTVVAVSAGSTFSGWSSYIDEPVAENNFPFTHHYITNSIRQTGSEGRFGAHALADFDNDGDLDFAVGNGFPDDHFIWWFENQGRDEWIRHDVGPLSRAFTSGTAHDVDGDGWMDIITSNYWYRNSGNPREEGFERHLYAADDLAGHDVIVADMNGDGAEDIVAMYGESDIFHWYDSPTDPRETWIAHRIWSEGIHGGFGPEGIGDLDGDGDNDVVRADIWLENISGDGESWAEHPLPFGDNIGPWGLAIRSVIVDIDEDGDNDIVVSECDAVMAQAAILYNVAGDGSSWAREDLPLTSPGGRNSLHSLRVEDFDMDGDLDVLTIEQEDMRTVAGAEGLPAPRWFIWENTGTDWVEQVVFDGNLGGHEAVTGDVDQDGDIDIVSKVWFSYPDNANGGREHADFLENRLIDRLDTGENLDGWTIHGGQYDVVDGAIHLQQEAGGVGGLLLSDRQYGDFGIEFEVWPDWGVDTGVYLRTSAEEHAYQICIDYQEGNPLGGIYGAGFGSWEHWEGTWDYTVLDEDEIQGSPELFELDAWSSIWSPGTWNQLRARIEGNPPHLQVWINGTLVTDLLETERWHEDRGFIGLQVHDGEDEWPDGAVARFRNIRVYDLALFDGGAAAGPTVRFTSPSPGEVFTVGDDVLLQAEASGGESPLVSVSFFSGETLLLEDNEAPFSTVWENVPAGEHLLRAVARNDAGETAQTTVTISASTGPGATIRLEAEEYDEMSGIINSGDFIEGCDDGEWIRFNDVNLGDGYNTLTALLAKPSTTEQRVELRLDSLEGELIATLIPQGTGGWESYEEQTTTVEGGTGIHDLYFLFVGEWGVGNFDWFELGEPNNLPPFVAIEEPVEGATFTHGDAVDVEVSASDPDGDIIEVELFLDGTSAGTLESQPFFWSLGELDIGVHQITARAVDDSGASASSEMVSFTVIDDDTDAGPDGGSDEVGGTSGGCGCRAANRSPLAAQLPALLGL